MAYIEKFLRAINRVAQKDETVTFHQLKKTTGLSKQQIHSCTSNYGKETFKLIKPIGARLYALNKENIESTLKEFEAGRIKLWYNANGQEKSMDGRKTIIIRCIF